MGRISNRRVVRMTTAARTSTEAEGRIPAPPALRRWRADHAVMAGLLGLLTIALVVFVAMPILGLLWGSIVGRTGVGIDAYVDFLRDPRMLEATWNTLLVSLGTAVGSALVAVPLAFGVTRTNMRGKNVVRVAVMISFASPPFLMTLAYILLGGPNSGYLNTLLRWVFSLGIERGPLNIYSLWGFIFLAIPSAAALVFLILVPAFQNMDPALEEASRIVGYGPVATIWRISMPIMRAGILAGGFLSFSLALAMYATPHMLGIDVLTVAIRRSLLVTADFRQAATVSVITTFFSLAVLLLYRQSIKLGKRYETIGGRGYRPAELRLGWARHLFTFHGWAFAIVGAFLPYGVLLLLSFMRTPIRGLALDNLTLDNYAAVFANPRVRTGLLNSTVLGIGSALLIAALGFGVAYIATRTKLRLRGLIDIVASAPLSIAGTAFAVGVIVVHLAPPLESLAWYGGPLILLAAYVGRYLPYGVRSSQVAVLQVGRELEEAARVSGATRLGTLRTVTIPLARAGIAYGVILGFVQSFSEVSASVMLRGPRTDVVATSLLELFDGVSGLQRAAALAVVMFLVSMALVLVAQRVGGQSIVPQGRGSSAGEAAQVIGGQNA